MGLRLPPPPPTPSSVKLQDRADDIGSLRMPTFPICSTALSRGSDGCSRETEKGDFLCLSTGSHRLCGDDPPESFGLLAAVAGRATDQSLEWIELISHPSS